ncbi:MAG: hydrolase 1, exosortase A system-associated [Nitrosomonadales bacterium]|nr:hydrolase 1, exosortase A system-associated [Nitrosomonadales bacterium]
MKYTEHAIVFNCADCRLLGIVTQPEVPVETGVLIVVGGPQYRAGSHRQFTLLARQLAGQGIASLRFDYRGMGDSEGEMRNFEVVDDDIRAAVDSFFRFVPAVRRVALWGLCDAASAALYYAHTDARVGGLILLNPWVHTEAGASRARIRHYYLSRLMQRSFWIKLISGKILLKNSVGDLAKSAQSVVSGASQVTSAPTNPRHGSPGYIDRMFDGLNRFRGNVLFILSGNDLVANEFENLVSRDHQWKKTCALPRITQKQLHEANHTFSNRSWRGQVEQWTARSVERDAVRNEAGAMEN